MSIGIALFLTWAGTRTVQGILFEIRVTGHLKRAADANTIELAQQEMEAVVKYLDANGINEGYTSIVWNGPNEDVSFWFQNLSAALSELEKTPAEATQLEKSNVLMKLRETILDGTTITHPMGISIFPFNTMYCFWAFLSGILAAVFGAIGFWKDF